MDSDRKTIDTFKGKSIENLFSIDFLELINNLSIDFSITIKTRNKILISILSIDFVLSKIFKV